MSAVQAEVRIVAVPAFADNYFWLIVRGRRALVVDPGDAAPVERALRAQDLQLDAILVTHHHEDHVGGVAALAQAFGAPVHGPATEDIPAITARHRGGERLELLGFSFEVLDVPGHTRGHIAYHARNEGWLFCGDTLFAGGCGRLFEGTPGQMADSLAQLAALPPSTRVYCAHEYTLANLRFARAVEPDNEALIARERRCMQQRERGEPTVPSTIGEELATNPFLRCHIPAVRSAAESRERGSGASPVSIFAAIRAWKNGFR
jgi:hydroxyacylglutathione hydrolase